MEYCKFSNQTVQPFVLPELPFSKDAFVPYFSPETFDYHHGKHHQAYVTNLNNLLPGVPEYQGKSLEEIITLSFGKNPGIFNNAAQIWNHSFFWHSISASGGGKPHAEILELLNRDFGSYENFVTEFKQAAATQFGSGWAWLVQDDGKLKIVKTPNAETPITSKMNPLIAIDVWEHAYYIDYRNKRPDYTTAFIDHMINWNFVAARLGFKHPM